jgi:hypothetical protein
MDIIILYTFAFRPYQYYNINSFLFYFVYVIYI